MTDNLKNKRYVAEHRKRYGMISAISVIIDGSLDDRNKIIAIKDLVKSVHKTNTCENCMKLSYKTKNNGVKK